MDYNQQRRSRSGYGGRRQMNYGQQAGSRGGCGCQPVQERCDKDRRPGSENKGCGCQSGQGRNDRGCHSDSENRGCGCDDRHRDKEMEDFALGMAYVPWQRWRKTYDPHRSLMSGTIFPELDKPFCAAGRCSR